MRPTVTVATELSEHCDRCGAAGKVRAFLPGGGDLTFCGHHATGHNKAILISADHVVVETGFGWRTV